MQRWYCYRLQRNFAVKFVTRLFIMATSRSHASFAGKPRVSSSECRMSSLLKRSEDSTSESITRENFVFNSSRRFFLSKNLTNVTRVCFKLFIDMMSILFVRSLEIVDILIAACLLFTTQLFNLVANGGQPFAK